MSIIHKSVVGSGKYSQAGLAALEFIICLPVLLMLAVLLIDVSRAFIQYTEINKALQNGVRYAVVDTYGTLDFGSIADEAQIKNMVVYGKPITTDADTKVVSYLNTEDVIVTPPTASSKEVMISASYTYVPIFSSLPFTDSSLAFEIGASSKMRTSP
ncbi:pilus assembly protein [Vibrio natriegens]|uniref:TadE/TadG family type IV pilus assembly protein n=1 Tax=Vibrio natriegens TaxID=691 RepID=UPI0021E92CA8|nr:TadE/TadG family type IV pilus assembly protein [Vibrio natriegens]UYI46494.1 pilus assembly protein [Vibrio natriegens]